MMHPVGLLFPDTSHRHRWQEWGDALGLRGGEDQRPDASDADERKYLSRLYAAAPEGMQCNSHRLGHRGALIATSRGHQVAHACRNLRQCSESSISVQPEHKILYAQVAPSLQAPATLPTPPGSPRHDPLTHRKTLYLWAYRRNAPDELMPQDHRTTMPTCRMPDIERNE